MRQRFTKKILVVGGLYKDGQTIKSISETVGSKMPTKAQYDDDSYVQNSDQLVRIVLHNGMIHYMKKGSYILK